MRHRGSATGGSATSSRLLVRGRAFGTGTHGRPSPLAAARRPPRSPWRGCWPRNPGSSPSPARPSVTGSRRTWRRPSSAFRQRTSPRSSRRDSRRKASATPRAPSEWSTAEPGGVESTRTLSVDHPDEHSGQEHEAGSPVQVPAPVGPGRRSVPRAVGEGGRPSGGGPREVEVRRVADGGWDGVGERRRRRSAHRPGRHAAVAVAIRQVEEARLGGALIHGHQRQPPWPGCLERNTDYDPGR
jgi:hypothetical protein